MTSPQYKYPYCIYRKWESLESCGLTLGKVSQHFINQTRASLYASLFFHAFHLSVDTANLLAFYHLLSLLALEFAQPGVMDMVHFLSKLQDIAQDPAAQLSSLHRAALHTITAGLLYLLGKISPTTVLSEHVREVVERRREIAPALLPDTLFARQGDGREGEGEDGGMMMTEGIPNKVADDLLFHLKERGLDRQSPEPAAADARRGSGCPLQANVIIFCALVKHFSLLPAGFLMRENSTTSNDFLPYASISLDYGGESPVSWLHVTS